jgi:hypothetical protein
MRVLFRWDSVLGETLSSIAEKHRMQRRDVLVTKLSRWHDFSLMVLSPPGWLCKDFDNRDVRFEEKLFNGLPPSET